MVEPPRLLEAPLGRLRPHELLVSERLQVSDDPFTDRLGRELAHRVGGEDVPDDRGRLDDRALLGSEPVDSRGKQRLDGRRDRHDREVAACVPAPVDELQPLLLDQHGEQLLDEQGIALGSGDHARTHVVVEPGVAEQVVDHPLAVTHAERLEHHVRRVRCVRPFGPELEQVGTRVAENEHRCVLDGLPHVLDEIEERRLRPVEILEHDDERTLSRELLEELAGRPEELLHRKLLRREPDHRRDSSKHVVVGAGERGKLLARRLRLVRMIEAGRLPDDFGQRPEGDPVAVREAAAAEHGRALPREAGELLGEPRLAHPGRSDERDRLAAAVAAGEIEGVAEEPRLVLAPDQRRLAAARDRVVGVTHAEEPVRRNTLGLALQLQRLDGLDLDRVPDEPIGRLADQHVECGRGLLEPRGHVHRVARHEALCARRVAGDDLARVDPGPVLEPDAPAPLELVVEPGERLLHREGCANGPQSVVLVCLRQPEDGHDRVADVLLDPASVLLERGLHLVEVPRHDLA